MLQKTAIIVAGGSGTRMKSELPKQFLMINGKPIIIHTIEAFWGYDPDISMILVLPQNHLAAWEKIEREFLRGKQVDIAFGGKTRFQSVKAGLGLVKEGLVAIHDAVRPLVSSMVIAASFEAADRTGSGVVMVELKDSIRIRKEDGLTGTQDRSKFLLVQTPQTFQVSLIKKAFDQNQSEVFTDDASVYEAFGFQVTPVVGEYGNIKITTPEDLRIAETLLRK